MTIFMERLQAVVTGDISDASRKLDQIAAQSKKTVKDMSGTATIKVEMDDESVRKAKAEMKAEADANPVTAKIKAEADDDSAVKAHEELKAIAGKDISVKTNVDTSAIGKAGGFLAGITGLKMDAAVGVDLNKWIGMGSLLASAVSLAGTAIVGLGGALVATLPATLALGGALGSLIPLAGAGLLAFSGFSKAMTTYTTAISQGKTPAQAFTTATVGMDTAQKNFMKTLIALEVPFKNLKVAIQGIVLPAATSFLDSMAKTILPVLIPGFTGAAGALAGFIKQLQGMLTAKDTISMIQQMNVANTDMIKNLLGAGTPAIHGFMEALFGVRGVALQVTESIKDGATKFDTWITAAQKSGSLATTVENAWQILRQLLDGIGNFAVAVGHVLAIGAPGLIVFAKAFNDLFTHMKDAVGPGQQAISGFFTSVGQVGQQLSGAFQSLGPGLAVLIEAFGKLASTTVGPALMAIAPTLSNMLGAFAGLGPVIGALITPLGQVITFLGVGLSNALHTVTPMLTTIANDIGQNLTRAAGTLMGVLPQLGTAFVSILNAVSPVLPVIATLVQTLAPALVTGISAIATSISNLTTPLEQIVLDLGQGLSKVLVSLAPQIPILANALGQVLTTVTPLVPMLATLVASFGVALVQGIAGLLGVLTPLLQALIPLAVALGGVATAILKIPVLGPLVAAFGALALIGGKMAISMIQALPAILSVAEAFTTKLLPKIKEAIAEFSALDLLETVGPWALLAVGIAGVTFGLGKMISWMNEAETEGKKAGNTIADSFASAAQSIAKPGDLSGLANTYQVEVDKLHAQNVKIVTDAQNAKDGLHLPAAALADLLRGDYDGVATFINKTGITNTTAINNLKDKIADLKHQQDLMQQATIDNYTAQGVAAGYSGNLATQYGELKSKGDALNGTLNTIVGTLENYIGSGLSAQQASDNWDSSLQSLNQTLVDNKGKVSATTSIINFHTGAQLAVKLAIDNAASSMKDQINQMLNSHAPAQAVIDKTTALTNQLITNATQYGLTKKQVMDYLAQLHLTPSQVTTKLTLDNYSLTVANIADVQNRLNALGKNYQATVTINGQVEWTRQAMPNFMGPLPTAAQGGVIGFKTASAAIVGEDRSGYDEYVIPTNPAHRQNALKLLGGLIKDLGMASGGVVGNVNLNLTGTSGIASNMSSSIQSTVGSMGGAAAAQQVQYEAAIKAAMARIQAALAASVGGAGQWAGVATQVASMLGQAGSVAAILRRINFESGGNPTAVNRTDSNWIAGHPSVGLAQVIGGTFAANAGPFRGTGPFMYGVSVDPLANVFAGMNYATHRYGSIAAVDPLVMHSGYDQGGILHPGITIATNNTGRDEYVSKTPPIQISVDARGSTNPAATKSQVMSGISEMLPILTQHLNR